MYIPSGSYYGIDLYRCEKTDISYNEVTKVSPNSSVIVEGIRGTDLTYANLIKGNSFTDLEITNMRGVHLYGNCAGLQMECNSFSDCDEAMFLGSVGQQVALSHQGTLNTATENNWYPYNSTYPYRIYSNVNPINWYYDNDNGVVFSNGKWPYSNDQNINLSGLSPQSELCGNPFSYNVLPERDIDPIIYETISFENDGAEHLYNLKSSLFQAFLNRDELDDNWMKDGDYNKWYEELYEVNIGLLERAEFIMASSTFEEKDEKAEDAYELFSSVTPNNRAEENKLVILNILHDNITIENYFNVLDSMDSADIDLIYEIAYQNSILGGEAVLWSRAMLNLFIMDEDPEPLARKKSIKNSTSQIQLALYPNPNHGTVNISSPEQCYLDIFDLRGTRIKRFENVVNNQNINLNLDNGFYFYRLTFVEGNISKTGTISVIK